MPHHNRTPQSVLDAPKFTPDPLYITTRLTDKNVRRGVRGAFVGDVERDLLGVTVGVSRKGRKVRRAGVAS